VISAMTTRKPRIALLAIPEVAASTLYGMLDLLASAGRDWAGLVEGREAESVLDPRVVSVNGTRPMLIANGVKIVPDGGTDTIPDVVCVPEVAVAPDTVLTDSHRAEIDWHDAGQLPFAALARSCQVDDAVIARCQGWIAEHYNQPSPVARMIQISEMSERNFNRRFKQATGLAPIEYVHTLRLEEAKQLLESGDEPVEAVAQEVGYEDAAFFGRLFRRKVGVTPTQYRKRFRGLRLALEEPGR
jgi:transcriptional regulator GlxA family with amidase domain